MNTKVLSKLTLIASLFTYPISASADMALSMCDNKDATLAEAILNADVIVWGEVLNTTENTKNEKHGKWVYSWTAKIKVLEVWKGKHEIGEVTFSGSCSGTANMSRNHCSRPPAAKGTKLAIYLKKGTDGKLAIAQPRLGAFSGTSCPGQSEIDKARKQYPKVFAKIITSAKKSTTTKTK